MTTKRAIAKGSPVAADHVADVRLPLSLREESRRTGIPVSTIHRRRAREASAQAAAEAALAAVRKQRAAAPKPKTAPMPDIGASLAALTAAVQQQSAALGVLLAAREPIVVPSVAAPPPAAPAPEKPRVRVAAGSAPVSPSVRDVDYIGPLGASGPYMGTVFGVSATRRPSVAAAVSRDRVRILAIGDSHFHPGLPQTVRCMTLVGLHAAASRPDHIVHIGDGSDWNSVCRHTRNDTWHAREKPSLRQDLDNWRENWAALNAPMDAVGVTRSRHYCMGNHDAWVEAFEDATPELKGLATGERDGVLERAGWSHTAYGEFRFVAGVGFVHVPLNLMGRPAGGQTPEVSISNQVTHDLVFGHTHRHNAVTRPKMGFSNRVTVLNCGSSMPEFYVGDYAQNTMGSAISHGVLDIDVFDGRIQGYRFVTMRELEERHGADADRRLA